MTRVFSRFLRRFRRDDDGGPSVEFVIVFVPFVIIFAAAFEMGMMMTRHVMLERGLDMAVREVRLNTAADIDEDDLKTMVCNSSGLIPDCTNQLKLEMRPIDLRAWSNIPRAADCVDVDNPFAPSRNFVNGGQNMMMVVRACARAQPLLPKFGLGYFLAEMDNGYYQLVSTSAFVMEPL
ncbi:MAG: TadE-like protein [Rhodobacteraceae bacterium HLUCCA08]|nr:MAG: TadE-like protein [Rhodobacteraceae bacterium HLUCCA08]